jgi:4-amino-4-deoxy-L-arabinose transferase-like glycosyltransferase
MIKNEKLYFTLLLSVSFFLTIYLFIQTYVIALDGAFQYIPIAKDFASGFFRRAISHNQQPLYPLIIAFVSRWVSDFELTGKLVSSFFGILIIFPVYFLGKRIFDEKIAFLSTLLLAIHPYIRRFSADVLKESTYLFFLGIAIWFAWRTIQSEKRYPYLFIPLFSALAYLVRPDGVEVLLVIFFYVFLVKKFDNPGKKGAVILLLLLSSFVLFLPYLIYLRESTGTWTLSRAKSFSGLLGLGVASTEVSFTYKILWSLKKLNLEILAIFHPVYAFLLIIGLLRGIFYRLKTGEGFLLSFCGLHYVVLFLMVLNTTEWGGDKTILAVHLSGRHVMSLLLVSIYWIGEGVITIYQLVSKKMESSPLFLRLKPRKQSVIIFVTLLVLILAIVLPKTLKPQRHERLPEKWAGAWIKNQSGKGATIFTDMPRVAYYADGSYEYIDFEKDVMTSIKASMVKKGAVYLVLRGREVLGYPGAVEPLHRDFIELMRYEEKGMEKIIVYKMVQ